ncbi:hypothetical protein SNE40_007024 [Patella caerulea]|uniref:CARD domain-containing protein n=1 Tax=Patella caerulea TaxID=87958 RepID=A0AAN8JT28_PATCE
MGRMQDGHYDIWRRYCEKLKEDFKGNVDNLVCALFADGIITDEDKAQTEKRQASEGNLKATSYLIDILFFRGNNVLPRIIQVLKRCEHNHWADILDRDVNALLNH